MCHDRMPLDHCLRCPDCGGGERSLDWERGRTAEEKEQKANVSLLDCSGNMDIEMHVEGSSIAVQTVMRMWSDFRGFTLSVKGLSG